MTQTEAEEYAKTMSYETALYNLMQAKCVPYRKATFIKVKELIGELRKRQKPDKWDKLYLYINDFALAVAPDETTPEEERAERLARHSILNGLLGTMERMEEDNGSAPNQ